MYAPEIYAGNLPRWGANVFGNELRHAIAEERAYIIRKVSMLPKQVSWGGEHHTLYLATMDGYNYLRATQSDLPSKWAKKGLNDFTGRLDSSPDDYIQTDDERHMSGIV